MNRRDRTGWAIVVFATIAMTVALLGGERFSVWVTTGVVGILALVAAFVFDRARVRRLLTIRPGTISWGIASGLGFVALTHMVTRAAFAIDPGMRDLVTSLYASIQAYPGPVAALPVIALVALMEEIVWRGILVDLLESRGRATTFVMAVVIYSLPHFALGNLALAGAAVGCGSMWTALRMWRGEIVTSYINHMIWDVAIFVVVPLT